MRDIPEVKPTLDLPISEAVMELRSYEVSQIQKHYGGRSLMQLPENEQVEGVVWAFENRDGKKTSWSEISNRTLRELQGYFEKEPEGGIDETTELGKESSD